MSRVITFRAWHKVERKMFYPNSETLCYFSSRLAAALMGYKKHLEDTELMQYTGLWDKHGTRIYEGDIVVYRNNKSIWRQSEYDSYSQVCFDEYNFGEYEQQESGYGWFLKGITDIDDGCALDSSNAVLYEVIANIYENPELLKRRVNNEQVNKSSLRPISPLDG